VSTLGKVAIAAGVLFVGYVLWKTFASSGVSTNGPGSALPPPPPPPPTPKRANPVELAAHPEARSGVGHF